jgi:pimeloyl-ACP methyl ester carboxylesterase
MSPAITLQTFIDDVANAIEAEEMDRVVLAVHSFAGMVGTAIADRMPQRIAHLVYVDAVLPQPGESWSSTQAPATREARIAASESSRDYSFPPPDPSVYGLTGAQHAWVQRRQVPHPGHSYTAALEFDAQRVAAVPRTFVDCTNPPLATIDASRRRVRDPAFWGAPWRVVELDTGHDPMVSAPQDLANVLLGCAP